jgi:hypothetical protein
MGDRQEGEQTNPGIPTQGAVEPNIHPQLEPNIVNDDIPVYVNQPGLGDVDGVLADMPELWLINYGDMVMNESMAEVGIRLLVGTHLETGKVTVQYMIDGQLVDVDAMKLLGALRYVERLILDALVVHPVA